MICYVKKVYVAQARAGGDQLEQLIKDNNIVIPPLISTNEFVREMFAKFETHPDYVKIDIPVNGESVK